MHVGQTVDLFIDGEWKKGEIQEVDTFNECIQVRTQNGDMFQLEVPEITYYEVPNDPERVFDLKCMITNVPD